MNPMSLLGGGGTSLQMQGATSSSDGRSSYRGNESAGHNIQWVLGGSGQTTAAQSEGSQGKVLLWVAVALAGLVVLKRYA